MDPGQDGRPAAVRRISVPALAPRASTESRLFASTSRSPAATWTLAAKPMAVRTKSAAGRACRSTPPGSVTTNPSELACATRVLRRSGDIVERHVRRCGHRRCDRALDDRRVHESDMAVPVPLEHMADGEDRAAEISENHDPGPLVRRADRRAHPVLVGSEAAVGKTAGGLDAHLGTGHLRSKGSETLRKIRAVRYDYDPDHGPLLLRPSPG